MSRCSICKTEQFQTPGGLTCLNRHGGAPSEEGEPVVRHCKRPPEGWYCMLVEDHDGPCPTYPMDPQQDPTYRENNDQHAELERLREALREDDALFEKLDEAMATPERIAADIAAVGSFVSGLYMTKTEEDIVKQAIYLLERRKMLLESTISQSNQFFQRYLVAEDAVKRMQPALCEARCMMLNAIEKMKESSERRGLMQAVASINVALGE